MQRLKKIMAVALCCVVLCFDAGSSYVYAADVSPTYTKGRLAWDGVAWALLSALGIATGEATGAVDYLTENVWTPLVAHLKEKWGSMCDVFIDKTNNKSYVSKDMMQDALDWGVKNDIWTTEGKINDTSIESGSNNVFQTEFITTHIFLQNLTGRQLNKSITDKFNYSIFKSSVIDKYNIDIGSYNLCYFLCQTNRYGLLYLMTLPANVYVKYIYNDSKIRISFHSKDDDSYISCKGIWIAIDYTGKLYTSLSNEQFSSDYKTALPYFWLNAGSIENEKNYSIDSGLTVPKAGEKIDDWLAAQDKVNGGSVGLLGNDVAIPSDVTGTGAAIDSLPLTIPSFADLVINGQLAIDDILSQGLVKANAGSIADTQAAAGAVAGAEDVAATGENAEVNAISVDQAQTALKNLMQQGIDYIAIEIPNNFWNKIPFSIPYDIYLLIHGIFVGSSGSSKKAPRREVSSGSNMPVGDPSNVGIEIDIPTVPLKYTEEKSEDTPPNFTFALNIPYTTPTGETANFNKEFTIETAKYNYFAKIIKFSIGLLWLSSVFQWLLAIFSKG